MPHVQEHSSPFSFENLNADKALLTQGFQEGLPENQASGGKS